MRRYSNKKYDCCFWILKPNFRPKTDLAPAHNMHGFIDRIMSTNFGLLHSFGKSPACPKLNLHLGRFFVELPFFVDFCEFSRFFTKKSPCPGRLQSKSIEPTLFCCVCGEGAWLIICIPSSVTHTFSPKTDTALYLTPTLPEHLKFVLTFLKGIDIFLIFSIREGWCAVGGRGALSDY